MGLRAKEPHFKLCVFISGCAGSSLLHSLVVESRGYCLAVSGRLSAEASLVGNTGSGALMPPSCSTQPQELRLLDLVAPRHEGYSWIKDGTHVPCIGRQVLYH